MPWPVTINGKTYTLADFAPYTYATSFPNIIQDVADIGAIAQTIVSGVTFGNSFRNRLINGDFRINQRGASPSSTAYAAGAYVMDRWKAGPNGVTLSFATSSNGDVVITITAGTLMQVIEGALYMPEGGVYTLSWSGTAQARFYQATTPGTFRSAPIVIGIGSNTNTTVEFSTGTVSRVQFEPGNGPTPFERRDDELRRCQRYFWSSYTQGVPPGTPNADGSCMALWVPGANSSAFYGLLAPYPVPLRTTGSTTLYSPKTGAPGKAYLQNAGIDAPAGVAFSTQSTATLCLIGQNITGADFIKYHMIASSEL